MKVEMKATISANTEEMNTAIRAGQEMKEAVANAIWSELEETTVNNLVEGVLVSVDKWTWTICEELHVDIQGMQPSI
jgi:hypothetical protein